ncbi:helix-turn-helix domain-containing protein [Burkholderia multivorans]|uniref:helix-turn-helix domain-containing protein n=1 Tax=Burkholderia multivorans TaxID=87883 RepID=UPI001F14B5EB|nr:helix-turn-helix transcriptional regulator [Burkholderia multivorans]
MSNIDTEKMKALAAELRANHEAMKSWMPTHQLESSPASKGADAIDTLLDECALLRSRVNALSDLVDSLLAARRACANEFPPDAEGEPDEGRIHENIRKLKAALEAAAADKREEPSLTNPLTPYGMLVRALRIVTGITLMDMATALLTTPAKLSAMEFGRAPVTPEFAFDVAAYFDALGVPHTASALRAAIEAPALSQRQEES